MKYGMLTQAAVDLRVAASDLSHHISNLEVELGIALFDRKPCGTAPTAAGYRLHKHARQILRSVYAAESDIWENCRNSFRWNGILCG